MLEIRCPERPVRLLLKIGGRIKNDDGANIIEVACKDCRTAMRKTGDPVVDVLHRFNVLGELLETEVVR